MAHEIKVVALMKAFAIQNGTIYVSKSIARLAYRAVRL